MAWCPREREWQTGGVGREVRAERSVRKVQGSRGLFSLGTGAAGPGVVVAAASGPGPGSQPSAPDQFLPGGPRRAGPAWASGRAGGRGQ